MNRIEFMTELSTLLQDISTEERAEAVQYYNDYFDDAGAENEKQVISELESPLKVAKMIKEGLRGKTAQDGTYGEDEAVDYEVILNDKSEKTSEIDQKNSIPKVVLIILIVLFGAPVVLPFGLAIIGLLIGLLAAAFGITISLICVSIAIMAVGVALFVAGLSQLIPAFAVGLTLCGAGMIVFVIGIVLTVCMVNVCIMAIPPMVRGMVSIIRKPFQRKEVVY